MIVPDHLKIWGRRAALNVQKVIWCAEELGITYEQIDAGQHYGKNNETFFLDMNPNGRIPVIQLDTFVLWESHAILRFLCNRSWGKVLPRPDEWQLAHSDQWLDWISSALYYPTFRNYYLYQTRTPEAEKDPGRIQQMQSEVFAIFRILEGHLARNQFAAGPVLTPADFSIGVVVNKWLRIDPGLSDFSQIHRYHEMLSARPLFKKHVHAYALNAV